MSGGEILINQLFAGKYLNVGGNIGHEIINLFEDDEGSRYLYITPNGNVESHNVEAIIFVRNVWRRRAVEVIAIALGLSAVSDDAISEIRYGGATMDQIFSGNTSQGERPTFKAEQLLVPSDGKRVLITVDPAFDRSGWDTSVLLDSTRKVAIPQGMRLYYSAKNDSHAYAELRDLISDSSLWEKAAAGKLVANNSGDDLAPTFLEIIGKENDELVFSNLFAHYFDCNHDAFKNFAAAENLLNIKNMESAFTITRESKYHIDLWIETASQVIVIENKIMSGINGLDGKGGSQLNTYRKKAEKYARSAGKASHFYVFAPDYSTVDIAYYDAEGVWHRVPYSAIHKFFSRNRSSFANDKYFEEFLRGLERHSVTSLSELNFKIMKSRFVGKILGMKLRKNFMVRCE